jgi:hypothetical protein
MLSISMLCNYAQCHILFIVLLNVIMAIKLMFQQTSLKKGQFKP